MPCLVSKMDPFLSIREMQILNNDGWWGLLYKLVNEMIRPNCRRI